MKCVHIVGARPNFIKCAAVMDALRDRTEQSLIHTGQHHDENMSGLIFKDLGISPDFSLDVQGAPISQMSQIISKLEPILASLAPELAIVYGDVNSTLAASIACSKMGIELAHVEAGLRSFDRSMPEEINRVLVDQLSDYLFTHSHDAIDNLLNEGVSGSRIYPVGNVMIDTLLKSLPKVKKYSDKFILVTLHRPSNVDDPDELYRIMDVLSHIGKTIRVIFPVHPRTRRFINPINNVELVNPMGYLEFLSLERSAELVITDSGGVQEETTYLGVPCLTLRENTERPVTVSRGTNKLIGSDVGRLKEEVREILSGVKKTYFIPPMWDGHASQRIADILFPSSVEGQGVPDASLPGKFSCPAEPALDKIPT